MRARMSESRTEAPGLSEANSVQVGAGHVRILTEWIVGHVSTIADAHEVSAQEKRQASPGVDKELNPIPMKVMVEPPTNGATATGWGMS